MRTALPTLLLCLAVGAPVAAQAGGDRWQITTETGEYLWDVRLVRLGGDTLFFRQADTLGAVRVAQIGGLRLRFFQRGLGRLLIRTGFTVFQPE